MNDNEHYHSGIGLLTPSSLHYGQAQEIINARKNTLHQAWQRNPERFVNVAPKPAAVAEAVWINPPQRNTPDKTEAPPANCQVAPNDTSLTHPRSDYPSVTKVPAAPTSVSPDERTVPQTQPLDTRAMPEKNPGGPGAGPRFKNGNERDLKKLSHNR